VPKSLKSLVSLGQTGFIFPIIFPINLLCWLKNILVWPSKIPANARCAESEFAPV
jgi:hypothetical protein